jgi:hypothetical protein
VWRCIKGVASESARRGDGGSTLGRAKNFGALLTSIAEKAIRAGFEPFRALGWPIASWTKTMSSERFGILGQGQAHSAAQNRRG